MSRHATIPTAPPVAFPWSWHSCLFPSTFCRLWGHDPCSGCWRISEEFLAGIIRPLLYKCGWGLLGALWRQVSPLEAIAIIQAEDVKGLEISHRGGYNRHWVMAPPATCGYFGGLGKCRRWAGYSMVSTTRQNTVTVLTCWVPPTSPRLNIHHLLPRSQQSCELLPLPHHPMKAQRDEVSPMKGPC